MLYDAFAQANQRASLYYIGLNVLRYPEAAQQGYLAGHEICAHTWSHSYLTTLTNSQVFAELYYSKKAIKDIVGVSTRCFRPPYGDVDDRVRTFAKALDMQIHLWVRDSDDWRAASEANGVQTVTQNYMNIINQEADSDTGIVVLQHESAVPYMQAFLNAWPQVQARFQHTMPVSTCNNRTQIYAEDESASYPTFSEYASGERADPWRTEIYQNDPIVFLDGPAASNNTASSTSSSSTAASSTSAPAGSASSSPRSSSARSSASAQNDAAVNSASTSDAGALTFALLPFSLCAGFLALVMAC